MCMAYDLNGRTKRLQSNVSFSKWLYTHICLFTVTKL